jgi:hypothetical protein
VEVIVATAQRTEEDIRREIAQRRESLTDSVAELRRELDQARRPALLDGKLPLAAGVAGTLGFLKGGGLEALAHVLGVRRGRQVEQEERSRLRLRFRR